jgi:hypothetical protein
MSFNRGLEGFMLLYDWVSHRLTLGVDYKTPTLSETDDNLFAVFKVIVDEFTPKEEKLNEIYPEKGKHLFYKNEIHDVLHYDRGPILKSVPSLRHNAVMYIPKDICRRLVSELFDLFLLITFFLIVIKFVVTRTGAEWVSFVGIGVKYCLFQFSEFRFEVCE